MIDKEQFMGKTSYQGPVSAQKIDVKLLMMICFDTYGQEAMRLQNSIFSNMFLAVETNAICVAAAITWTSKGHTGK